MSEEPLEKFEETLEDIEANLFQLVGQIDYGEISNIETYWASLTESIEKLAEFGYPAKPTQESLSEALGQFATFIDRELQDLAHEMESFCEGGGSTDSVDSDEIDELQDKAIDFEKKFLDFTQTLRSDYASKTH